MNNFENPKDYWAWHKSMGLSQFINVSGTNSELGGSIVRPVVRDATVDAMGRFVKMHELQRHASEVISRLTGSEAGYITASASAGISVAIAGCMTGVDAGRAESLPLDTGPRSELAVQIGHLCNFGAPVASVVELTGAKIRPVGQSTQAADYQLDAALTEKTAAALYIVSHHVVHYGQIPFERFVEIAHAKGVPVIVDAASEYDLRGFIAGGADIAIYSGHKFLGGPTSGIIAGRRDLVRAAYLQNMGIGRGMKVGKESIAGVIAAMEEWMKRDHAAILKQESAALDLWQDAVAGLAGIHALRIDDPTQNPLQRLQINVDADKAGANAAGFARALGECEPSVIVRNHEVELGYFQLDPCNLTPGQPEIVAKALAKVLSQGSEITPRNEDFSSARNSGVDGYLSWLEEGK